MVEAISNKLTNLIKMNISDINDEKAEIINYGIQSMISEIYKTIIILFAAWIFGILKLILIAIAAFGIYRTFAGGAHARTQTVCLISNSLVFFSIVGISKYLNINSVYFLVPILMFNILIIYFYAPADVEEKPILSKKLRHSLKIKSYIVMFSIFIAATFMISNQVISNILIISTFYESLTLLPISYKIMGCARSHQK